MFNGEDDRNFVQDFVFRLEFRTASYRCLWDKILRNLVLVLGRAERFRRPQTEHERMQELLEREQQPGVKTITSTPCRKKPTTRLKKPMPERQLVSVVKKT